LYSAENDRRARLPFSMVSMMDILSGRCRPIVDVRQNGSSPRDDVSEVGCVAVSWQVPDQSSKTCQQIALRRC
ncbi:MAG: hypothetical protein ABSD97_10215, partial [Acidimicrobiales bacterium]